MKTLELSEIGLKAVNLCRAVEARKQTKEALGHAYSAWKHANKCHDIERNSEEWDRMLAGTKAEYKAAKSARDAERRALARVVKACAPLLAKDEA